MTDQNKSENINEIRNCNEILELISTAKNILKQASDPVTAVIDFLHTRPEGKFMSALTANEVLEQTFNGPTNIPQLVKILANQMSGIIRQSNSIIIDKQVATTNKLGQFIVKQMTKVKFDIKTEQGVTVLSNIKGLIGVEHGIELPIDKIKIIPPKLIVIAKLGILSPQRIIDM